MFVWPIWPEVNCPYFHTPGKSPVIGLLQDHFHIEAHIVRANMGLNFVSGQYGCLFSRCWKYVINSLVHGHFHVGLVIIPRPILALDSVSDQYGGVGMIIRPIWKCPCINLYLLKHCMLECGRFLLYVWLVATYLVVYSRSLNIFE